MAFLYRQESTPSVSHRLGQKREISRLLAEQKLGASLMRRTQKAAASKKECDEFPEGAKVRWIDGSIFTVKGQITVKHRLHEITRITVYESKAQLDPKELTLV